MITQMNPKLTKNKNKSINNFPDYYSLRQREVVSSNKPSKFTKSRNRVKPLSNDECLLKKHQERAIINTQGLYYLLYDKTTNPSPHKRNKSINYLQIKKYNPTSTIMSNYDILSILQKKMNDPERRALTAKRRLEYMSKLIQMKRHEKLYSIVRRNLLRIDHYRLNCCIRRWYSKSRKYNIKINNLSHILKKYLSKGMFIYFTNITRNMQSQATEKNLNLFIDKDNQPLLISGIESFPRPYRFNSRRRQNYSNKDVCSVMMSSEIQIHLKTKDIPSSQNDDNRLDRTPFFEKVIPFKVKDLSWAMLTKIIIYEHDNDNKPTTKNQNFEGPSSNLSHSNNNIKKNSIPLTPSTPLPLFLQNKNFQKQILSIYILNYIKQMIMRYVFNSIKMISKATKDKEQNKVYENLISMRNFSVSNELNSIDYQQIDKMNKNNIKKKSKIG